MIVLLWLGACGPIQRIDRPGTLCRQPLEEPVDTGLAPVSLAVTASWSGCRSLESLSCDLTLFQGDIVASAQLVTRRTDPPCRPTRRTQTVACEPDIPDAASRIVVYGEQVTDVLRLPVCATD